MKKTSIFLSVFLLSACANADLAGQQFVLTDNPALPITLSFDKTGHRFSGKAVNNYFGSYRVNGQQLALSQIGSTMMMGAPDEMAAETTYFQNLAQVQSYQLENNQLILILADGQKLHFQKEAE